MPSWLRSHSQTPIRMPPARIEAKHSANASAISVHHQFSLICSSVAFGFISTFGSGAASAIATAGDTAAVAGWAVGAAIGLCDRRILRGPVGLGFGEIGVRLLQRDLAPGFGGLALLFPILFGVALDRALLGAAQFAREDPVAADVHAEKGADNDVRYNAVADDLRRRMIGFPRE